MAEGDQMVYLVFCKPGDPKQAKAEWPDCPDGQSVYLGLDPQDEAREVWLWFVAVDVDPRNIEGLRAMPFVFDVQPVARRYSRLVP